MVFQSFNLIPSMNLMENVELPLRFAEVDRNKREALAQTALRWILEFPAVTAAIPGARNAAQVESNVRALELPPLSDAAMAHVRAVYDRALARAAE